MLLYTGPLSDAAKARLKAMRETHDGFEISRRDLMAYAKSNPEEGQQLTWRLVQYLGERVRDLSEKVATVEAALTSGA